MFLHGKYFGNCGASDLNSLCVYLFCLLFPMTPCSRSNADHVAHGEKTSWYNEWELPGHLPFPQLRDTTVQFRLLKTRHPLSLEDSRHRRTAWLIAAEHSAVVLQTIVTCWAQHITKATSTPAGHPLCKAGTAMPGKNPERIIRLGLLRKMIKWPGWRVTDILRGRESPSSS